MRRASLTKKLKSISEKKLCLLYSGAGFGKSSAIAQYLLDLNKVFSWYSITEEDDDILPFLRHLVSSIQKVVPSFGHQLLSADLLSMYPKEAELTRWYSLFSNELSIVKKPLTIVLDDFHLVDHVFHINYMMEKIIEFLPSHVHIIVASRIRPKWTILLKLKMNGLLVEVSEKDLVFTEEEIMVFFEDYVEKVITAEEASKIGRLTEGWAIAIQLLAAQFVDSQKQITHIVDPALKDLFSYLSEEVFSLMNEKDQASLLHYSIFPVFSREIVNEFFGQEELQQLECLTAGHTFIQSLSEDGTYRFHALFQQFLESKCLQKDRAYFYDCHQRASLYFIEKQNMVQAIYHAVKANNEKYLGSILTQFAPSMIRAGQFDWLLDLIKENITSRETFYALYFYEGECHRYRAFYEKARRSYELCLESALKMKDIVLVSKANAGIAHIYLDTIQPALAKPYLEESIRWAENSLEMNNTEKQHLKRLLAENLVNLGRANEAKQWVEKEKLAEELLKEGNLDGRIYLRTGMLRKAAQILQARLGDELALPDSHRETDILLSFIYSLTGEIEEAKRLASKGIETGIKEKSGFVEAVAWIRKGHAEFLTNPYNLNTPEMCYLKAVKRIDELNVSRAKAEPFMGLSILKSRQGNLQEAISYGEKGLAETIKSNDYWLSAYIFLGLSIIYFENHLLDKSEAACMEANKLFLDGGDVYGLMLTHYWLLRVFNEQESLEAFTQHCLFFSNLCVDNDFWFFLEKQTIFGPPDLEINNLIFQKATKLIPESSLQAITARLKIHSEINYPGYELRLQLLGPFSLFMGQVELEDRKWQRDKSKELLAYLYMQKNRFVPKEELIKAIWPESDEKILDRDFKVILNSLLKAIEPNRLAREESYFIQRRQSMYRLNPHAKVTSDLELFHESAEKGLQESSPQSALEYLMRAVELYKGPLLEDRPTIEWIFTDRERTEQQYLFVLERLAQTCTRVKDFEKAIYWAERLLRIEPTWEEAYRLLMFAYYQQKNRVLSVKWYEKCVAILKQELRVEPMPTTVEMYEMITNYS